MNSERESRLILAVDGGGSKTIAWIAKAIPTADNGCVEMDVVGRGHAGPSNPRSVGFDNAYLNIKAAISMAREKASDALQRDATRTIAVACLSLAGAGRVEEQSRIREWSDSEQLAVQTMVVDDVEPLRLAAMYEQSSSPGIASTSWDQCVTLVVGTGTIACGRNGTSGSARVGGWGYLLGDEGSGFAIGLAGLQAVCKSHDRLDASTPFQIALLDAIEINKPSELVGFIYQNPLPRDKVAALSEIVIRFAIADPVAAKILAESIQAMSDLVVTTASRLSLEHRSYSLVLSGGLVCNHPEIVAQLLNKIEQSRLAPAAHHLVREPIHGPLLMAARHAGKSGLFHPFA